LYSGRRQPPTTEASEKRNLKGFASQARGVPMNQRDMWTRGKSSTQLIRHTRMERDAFSVAARLSGLDIRREKFWLPLSAVHSGLRKGETI